MVKKRLIFTLLYNKGAFMLSRNFRLQRVGDSSWLQKNYNFSSIATAIDELIILDVTRDERDIEEFCRNVQAVSRGCFIPLALGGGVRSENEAKYLLDSGAEKVVVNSLLHTNPEIVRELVRTYGSQCIVGSIDFKIEIDEFLVFVLGGTQRLSLKLHEMVMHVVELDVGEIYLNSIDRDGTGHGYCMEALDQIPASVNVPIIMAGGAGNYRHLLAGINHRKVDAVATANLFNFVGTGLPDAREELLRAGVELARWSDAK